jgi:hypothetical protein
MSVFLGLEMAIESWIIVPGKGWIRRSTKSSLSLNGGKRGNPYLTTPRGPKKHYNL